METTSLTDTTHLWLVWYRAPTPSSLKNWVFLLTPSSADDDDDDDDETTSASAPGPRTAYQAERYDDASDGGSSPAPHHHHRSGGNAQYFMTIIPDARALTTARRTSPPALSSASRSRSPAFAVEGRLYLGALPATTGALAYFRDCCETGIEMLNAHNTASNDGEMQRPHNHPHTRTHQDWVLDVVSALEDAAIVRTGTVGLVKACPRRGW